MLAWLDYFLFAKRVLRGREADFAQCRIEGIDDQVVETALTVVSDAFMVPKRLRYCLRPDDTLMSLYLDGRAWRFCDDLEFTYLFLELAEKHGACLTEAEVDQVKTVGDVARSLAND